MPSQCQGVGSRAPESRGPLPWWQACGPESVAGLCAYALLWRSAESPHRPGLAESAAAKGVRASLSSLAALLVAPRTLVAEWGAPGLRWSIHGGIRYNVGGIVLS